MSGSKSGTCVQKVPKLGCPKDSVHAEMTKRDKQRAPWKNLFSVVLVVDRVKQDSPGRGRSSWSGSGLEVINVHSLERRDIIDRSIVRTQSRILQEPRQQYYQHQARASGRMSFDRGGRPRSLRQHQAFVLYTQRKELGRIEGVWFQDMVPNCLAMMNEEERMIFIANPNDKH